ncbi:MAG: phosphatidylglycerol lysyltransferase domain-containing protein [Elusimicrobia bacterium]|nr:phosphatidylglycerol lysyltransferase domain-containing protein [Elusimicrobiota bacterium]
MRLEPLRPSHYAELAPYFAAQQQPLSVYSLASLIAWSQCIYDTFFAVDDGAAIFVERRMDDPRVGRLLLPVCPGGLKPPAWVRERAAAAECREINGVSQRYLDAFRPDIERLFAVSEQRDQEDYVYRAADLAGLPGRDYAKKRNLVRQFERDWNGAIAARRIAPGNSGECLECLEQWRAQRAGQDWTDVLECERRAITRALGAFSALGFEGVMISVAGRVRAFGIGSRLAADTWALHFEKAADQIKGLYQYLDRECARSLFPGLAYINKESDMGAPGLAKAKQSYHPAFKVKSYKLTLL